jgi:uncharacterized SAM-binding protein YcdF (DUF218 family)
MNSGLSSSVVKRISERGARMARRDDREYREYLREEQRSQLGCPARKPLDKWRGRATLWRAALAAAVLALGIWMLVHAGAALVVFVPAEPPDAILPLASHEWERLPKAAALAQQFPASVVLLTMPAVVTEANCHRCGDRSGWLIGQGLRAERVTVLPDRGAGTHDEAEAARNYAERHGVRRLAIVTSPYHARRALATFQTVFAGLGTELGVYPACGDSPARPDRWWAQPYDRAYVAYEWTAILYYRVKFRVPLVGAPGDQSTDSMRSDEPHNGPGAPKARPPERSGAWGPRERWRWGVRRGEAPRFR